MALADKITFIAIVVLCIISAGLRLTRAAPVTAEKGDLQAASSYGFGYGFGYPYAYGLYGYGYGYGYPYYGYYGGYGYPFYG